MSFNDTIKTYTSLKSTIYNLSLKEFKPHKT